MMSEEEYERLFQETRKEARRVKVSEAIAIVMIVVNCLVYIYGALKICGVI